MYPLTLEDPLNVFCDSNSKVTSEMKTFSALYEDNIKDRQSRMTELSGAYISGIRTSFFEAKKLCKYLLHRKDRINNEPLHAW